MSRTPESRLRPAGLSNRLWNEDLAATPRDEQTAGLGPYIALWTCMSVCIPAYMLASGLIALGMDAKEALGTILLGNLIVLVPVVLNAHPGTKYGIPFSVLLRAGFGVLGAKVPEMMRSLVISGWFGIQCWIGGEALFAAIRLFLPGLGNNAVWGCFAAFWLLSMAAAWQRIETMKSLHKVSTALLLMTSLALLFWMASRAGGFDGMLAGVQTLRAKGSATPQPAFWRIFVPALTATVGFWATVSLSVSDHSRCARSQRAQMVGQAIGAPTAMTLYSLLAFAVTAATVMVTPNHRSIWNPIALIASFPHPVVAGIGLATVLFATLTSNLAMNIVIPSQAFSNLRPDRISVQAGEVITGLLGILWMPWRLLADPQTYMHGWLIASSGLLGPIAGIVIVDYFVLRRRWLDLNDLYVRDGIYEYHSGFNRRALVALTTGVVTALIGMFLPQLHWLYECAWFVGFSVAGLTYLALMSGPDVRAMIPPNALLIPVDGFEPESPMA